MEKNAIYKIIKTEDNGYGSKREFEISFSEKLNLWVCYELITLDNGEINSKLLDRGDDIIGVSHTLI